MNKYFIYDHMEKCQFHDILNISRLRLKTLRTLLLYNGGHGMYAIENNNFSFCL